jgi:hypothetical protein
VNWELDFEILLVWVIRESINLLQQFLPYQIIGVFFAQKFGM